MEDKSGQGKVWILPTLLLFLVAGMQIAWGVAQGGWITLPIDSHLRWIEEQYILKRQNPADVTIADQAIKKGVQPPSTGRNSNPDPVLGVPLCPDYPPWAYVSGLLFFSPPWSVDRLYFTAINLVALGVLGWIGYGLGREFGKHAALFVLAATLAMDANRWVIEFGQYPLVVVSSLAGAMVLAQRKRDVACGVLLGVAMLKPNITAPFLLCFLVRRQFKPVAIALGIVAAQSLLAGWLVKTNPIEMIRQMEALGEAYAIDRGSPLKALVKLGVPLNAAIPLLAGGCLAVGAALIWWRRRDSFLLLMAIACFTARVWTYHRWYDNVMMVFLLWGLARQFLSHRTPLNSAALFATGLALWAPFGAAPAWFELLGQLICWLFGLWVLLTGGQAKTLWANDGSLIKGEVAAAT
jgi:glycosyl transferase family 87